MSRTESAVPPPAALPAHRAGGPARRLFEAGVLGAHRLADRFDLIPPEFGSGAPVDDRDADAVLHEWRRQLRLWADYNPEQIFALKVGGGLLLVALAGLWIIVATML